MLLLQKNELHGWISVYSFRNGLWSTEIDHHNTLTTTYYTSLRNKLTARDAAGRGASIDGMTWGSFNNVCGSFVDGTYAGTFAAGTNDRLIVSTPTVQQARFVGTFIFGATKSVNYFELGQGYAAPNTGVTALITTRYAYDQSLFLGSSSLTYESGERVIIDWLLQVGA